MTQIVVTRDNFPTIRRAFDEVECDNGGHLIGTVYPGEPINLEAFEVPEKFAHLLAPAEAGLIRLWKKSQEDWLEFVCGEQGAAEAIEAKRGDLKEARQLLNAFFDGWSVESDPRKVGAALDRARTPLP